MEAAAGATDAALSPVQTVDLDGAAVVDGALSFVRLSEFSFEETFWWSGHLILSGSF